ncbi:outer membrane beta-barrel protein [Bizionia paragorgiae]|uniref:outer membrane beta-barrel protein n=1 Tax=Bizionia paragorgiae TaxID=283786 RepID=UPI003A953243
MKTKLLFILITLLSLSTYSQISFEKGYFVNNANKKTECLIKNMDWKNNPTTFEFKRTESSDIEIATIETVAEFGIYNISKYVRSTTKIDRSSKNIKYLTTNRNPEFTEETLFLKVLIEGQATLYSYIEPDLRRYFYSKDPSKIDQLIFKSYFVEGGNIAKNNRFRQQLFTDVNCDTFKKNRINNVSYTKSSLIDYFMDYNGCHSDTVVNLSKKRTGKAFNLTIRPRINSASVSIKNTTSNSKNFDFANETTFGIGAELEYILPFNKNKWSFIIEPTIQKYTSEETISISNVSGGSLRAEVDYNSIELPVSIRHYMFLTDNSKLFVNASFVFDFSSGSTIELKRSDNSTYDALPVKSGSNVGIGLGYKLYDKFSAELRYLTSRELTGTHPHWEVHYNSISLIVGYSLF